MLDEDAGILDGDEACGARFFGRGVILNSLLHPDYFCADGDGAVHDGRNVFGAAKNIDDLDLK